jgi:hypothetical protein
VEEDLDASKETDGWLFVLAEKADLGFYMLW